MPDAAAPAVADAIGTQIAWSRLIGLVDEAAIILGKTSFSPIVRESHDYSCVLLSAEGDVVAQENLSLPTFIYSLQQVAKAVLERRPVSEWRPGDMYCTNDPWLASADLHDLHVMAPIFRDGKVIAFAANAAHWPDMGGRQWSSVAREVFEEGLRIPPTPLMREGVFDEGLADLIKANVRLPDQAMGDLHAQVVTNQTMAAALERVLDEGLIADFPSFAADLMNRSEQAMRDGIAAFPDGTYRYEVELDGFEERLYVRAAVTVAGSDLTLDFSGSSPQIDRGVNSLLNYTVGTAMIGVRAIFDPVTPNNGGTLRPVQVVAPEGTIVNALPPVATGGRAAVGHFATMAVLGALSQAGEGRVYAEYGNIWPIVFTGHEQGRPWAGILILSNGVGARADGDGWSCRTFPTNASASSIEVLETTAPLVVLKKSYSPGSGGAGRYRGGHGQELEIELLGTSTATVTAMPERIVSPPKGVLGGEPGRGGEIAIDGEAIEPKAFARIEPGQRLSIRTSGGGGLGPAAERDPELIRRDERAGLVRGEERSDG